MHLVVDPSVAQSWMGNHWMIRFWIWNHHHLASWTRFRKVTSFQTWQRISAKVQVPSIDMTNFFLFLSTSSTPVFGLIHYLSLDFLSAEMTPFLTSETNNFSDSTGGDHTRDCWIILHPFFFRKHPMDTTCTAVSAVYYPYRKWFSCIYWTSKTVSACLGGNSRCLR